MSGAVIEISRPQLKIDSAVERSRVANNSLIHGAQDTDDAIMNPYTKPETFSDSGSCSTKV